MRRALRELKDETKLEGSDTSYQANAAIKRDPNTARDEARDEIAGQMRESFGALAQAAVAKSDTLDANATTIASLTKAIAVLTETNRQLVAALAAKSNSTPAIRSPPGFTPAASQDMTGHFTNSTGQSCPTKKWKADGRWQFITRQFCKGCNGSVNHIPTDCPELPGNEAIKAEMQERRAKRNASRAAAAAQK